MTRANMRRCKMLRQKRELARTVFVPGHQHRSERQPTKDQEEALGHNVDKGLQHALPQPARLGRRG